MSQDDMPRINIEDALFRDARFTSLCIKVGSRPLAIGLLVEAWIVAQKFWKNSENGIPKSVWKQQGLSDEIIKVGLAEDRSEFVYMAGSRENFSWLTKNIESGRKGGETRSVNAKSLKKSSSVPKRTQPSSSYSYSYSNNTRRGETELASETEENTLSLRSGLSPTVVVDGGSAVENPPNALAPRKRTEGGETQRFIAAYANAYRSRYGPGTRPEIDGKAAGIAKSVVSSLGADRACELVQVYLQLDDKWFQTKSYDLVTFKENLNKISLAHSTGRQPKDIDAKLAEEQRWKKFREAVENES